MINEFVDEPTQKVQLDDLGVERHLSSADRAVRRLEGRQLRRPPFLDAAEAEEVAARQHGRLDERLKQTGKGRIASMSSMVQNINI